jgi:SAM-dependent methyltransferase
MMLLSGVRMLHQKIWKQMAVCYRILRDAKFDVLNSTDTSGYITAEELGLDASGNDYGASPERRVNEAFRHLPIPFREFTLIDLGCGKGRVLLLAQKFGFKQIVGVEVSEKLAQIAARNVRKFANISVVAADAAKYEFPNGPIVIYLGNPFRENVMEAVLANIDRHLKQDSSPIYILYLVPEFRGPLDKSPFLKQIPAPRQFSFYVSAG